MDSSTPSSSLAGYGPAEDAAGATALAGYGPAESADGATPDAAHWLPRSFGEAASMVKNAAVSDARLVRDTAVGLGRGVLRAGGFAGQAIAHPIDTTRQIASAPGASFRESMRAINSNIPGASQAVQAIGGPLAESPEDAAAAPRGLRDFVGLASAPGVGKVLGGVAAKTIEAGGEAASNAVGHITEAVRRARAERIIKNVQDLGTRAQGTKIEIGREGVGEVLRADPELAAKLDARLAKPKELHAAVTADAEKTGAQIGEAYKKADTVALGAPMADVRRSLQLAKRMYNNPIDKPLREQIDATIANFEEQFGKNGRVPLTKLWESRSALQKRGFSGPANSASIPKELQRDAAQAVQRVIDKRIDEIKSLAAGVRQSTGQVAGSAPLQQYAANVEALEELPALNKRYSALAKLSDATERAATAPPPHEPGLLSRVLHHGRAQGAGALVGSVVGHHVAGYPGAIAGTVLGAGAGRVASSAYGAGARAIATAVKAARAGTPLTEQMIQDLATAGVGAKAIEALSAKQAPAPATSLQFAASESDR